MWEERSLIWSPKKKDTVPVGVYSDDGTINCNLDDALGKWIEYENLYNKLGVNIVMVLNW